MLGQPMLVGASVRVKRDLQARGCKAAWRLTVLVSLTAKVMPSQEPKSTRSAFHAVKWTNFMLTGSLKRRTAMSLDHQTMTSSPALVCLRVGTVTHAGQKTICLFFTYKNKKNCPPQPATSQMSTLLANTKASPDSKTSQKTRSPRQMTDSELRVSEHLGQTATNQRITLSRTSSRTLSMQDLLCSVKVNAPSSTSTGSRKKRRSCQLPVNTFPSQNFRECKRESE